MHNEIQQLGLEVQYLKSEMNKNSDRHKISPQSPAVTVPRGSEANGKGKEDTK
jgi:hypothetical protein